MPYWRCFYHVVWATKYREPLITPVLESVIYGMVANKCEQLECELFAINGIEDHVHIALSIPPARAPAQVIRQIKGITSHNINNDFTLEKPFQWQGGYGILTFGEKVMPQVIDYITHQKTHHAQGNTHDYLERIDDEN